MLSPYSWSGVQASESSPHLHENCGARQAQFNPKSVWLFLQKKRMERQRFVRAGAEEAEGVSMLRGDRQQ